MGDYIWFRFPEDKKNNITFDKIKGNYMEGVE